MEVEKTPVWFVDFMVFLSAPCHPRNHEDVPGSVNILPEVIDVFER